MIENIFSELSIVIITAVIVVSLTRLLKQPIILGYIITGIIVSPSLLNVIQSTDIILTLSQLGIALLLFIVGINLNPKVIKEVGHVSLITGVGQFIFTSIIGYFIGAALGFSPLTSIYIAVALSFSSTIVVTKLLSDKGDLHKLYGKISIGFLIIQDIIAITALMFITSIKDGGSIRDFAFTTFTTGTALFLGIFVFSYFILPRITKPIAKSDELLLIFALGWCFAISAIFNVLGFSIEIGALLAGITLSLSPYRFEISSKLKPIRDFFIFLFFVWLGSQVNLANIQPNIPAIILFSLFVIIGDPLVVMILMGLLRFKKQTGFMAGLTVAQISEFSLVLVALGVEAGHLSPDILSLVTVVGIITMAGSTYFINYANKIYPHISKYLSIFERKSARKEKEEIIKKYDVILFGAHKTGHEIIEAFKTKKSSLLVVDHNPDVIDKLTRKGFNCVYGDIGDIDLLDVLNLCDGKMIISTIPDKETNLLFIKRVKMCSPNSIVLVVAEEADDALDLYKYGATYVITPRFIGGRHISDKVKKYQFNMKKFMQEQSEHIKNLKKLKEELK